MFAPGYMSAGDHRRPLYLNVFRGPTLFSKELAACVNRSCPTRGHVSGVVEDDAIIRLAERPVRTLCGTCLDGRQMR
jgi:hypothetical protein